MRFILPVGRSSYAIAAGYLGLFSIVVFFLGPLAILFGVLGIRDIKANEDKHGMGRCVFGIIVGVVASAVLVLFLIGLAGAFD